ncbi:hypothetical protein LBMAG42_56170 [Deltaproteobacteria bacterium]|nr:hypothetical protein LBMAG42_56170 [Deltaproteobacteria bacterium]
MSISPNKEPSIATAEPREQDGGIVDRGRAVIKSALSDLTPFECAPPKNVRLVVARQLAAAVADLAALAVHHPDEWAGAVNYLTIAGLSAAIPPLVRAVREKRKALTRAAAATAGDTSPPSSLEHLTDLGNARRFVAIAGNDFRWCPSMPNDGWMHWTRARWEPDVTRASIRQAKRLATTIRAEAHIAAAEADDCAGAEDASEKARKRLMTWADESESARTIAAVLSLVRTEAEIIVSRDELDVDPCLFNTPNGTIDLKTGAVHANRREDMLTEIGGVGYDAEATCPRWEAFVLEIMGGDPEMAAYLNRIAGSCMTAEQREPAFYVFCGGGRNGKTTYIERIRRVLGSYAVNTPATTFTSGRDGIPNDLAALASARMVTMSESDEGAKLNESLIKRCTGGDPVTARFMRSEFFQFIPKFTPIMATNHRPDVRGTDDAIWARIHFVPFLVSFQGREDYSLPCALDAEAAGIQNWMLRGLRDWREGGLRPPAAAGAAGQEYRDEMDAVGQFLIECVGPGSGAENKEMFSAFHSWSVANGEFPRSQRWLTQQLKSRGFKQGSGGSRSWRDIRIKQAKKVDPR